MKHDSTRFKYLSMALIACSLILVVTGMGAFTTATSDRQMSVDVAEGSAFLDIEAADPTVSQTGVDYSIGQLPAIGQNKIVGNNSNDTEVILGTLTNRFSNSLTSIDVTVSEEGSREITVRNPTVADKSIASGDSSQLTAIVECDTMTGTTETVNVSIEASGPSTAISTSHPVQITCAGGQTQTDQAGQTGSANATTQPLQP